jgi:hypothetical protein
MQAMDDRPAEPCGLGVFIVVVQRMGVAGERGEAKDVLENVWPLLKSSRKSCVVSSAIARSYFAGAGSHPSP